MPRNCWICDQPILLAGVEIIGHIVAGRYDIAHRTCAQAKGELELDLLRAEGIAASGSTYDGSEAA